MGGRDETLRSASVTQVIPVGRNFNLDLFLPPQHLFLLLFFLLDVLGRGVIPSSQMRDKQTIDGDFVAFFGEIDSHYIVGIQNCINSFPTCDFIHPTLASFLFILQFSHLLTKTPL